MDHYVSPAVDVPSAVRDATFSRADLLFYGVSHRGNSYRALVFLDSPTEPPQLSPTRQAGFAGSFTIFGHGGCVGSDPSHCEPTDEPDDPFDTRPPHALAPQTKLVDITEAL